MSSTPRLFLPDLSSTLPEFELDGSASHYLVKVLRLNAGDPFMAFDRDGRGFELILLEANPLKARARVQKAMETKADRASFHITLGQSLPKASKMDLILRQATEAGADRFIPFLSRRSVSRPEEGQFEHKHERWKKILVEACRQSGRNDVPTLEPLASWKDLLKGFEGFDLVLVPFEKEAPMMRTVLESNKEAKRILVLIGPEGGWDPQEIQEAQERGAFPVHLPTPILRTETAGIAVVSMIRFFLS